MPAKAALVLASVHIHCCGCGYWWFRPDGRLPLANAPKEAKVSPQASGPSPRLGVPSLRYPSGGIALRFAALHLHAMGSTASNGAARQSPDGHLHSASRRGGWIKIKSCRRATARPVEWWKSARGGRCSLWERACSRRRPVRRPTSSGCTPIHSVGARLAREDGLTADLSLPDVPQSKLWERACSRWRPASRPSELRPRCWTSIQPLGCFA